MSGLWVRHGHATMKIVFMGTPEFACAVLSVLIESHHELAAVVTGPDKPVGRRRVMTPTAVHQLARGHNLPVLTPSSLKDSGLRDELARFEADLFIVAAFRILPPSLFELPKLGSINIHASLLPRYRGAAPINWAIINGETETGLTSFFLKRQVDTGDMILQTKVPITPNDTYDSLHDRLTEKAGPFTLETLDLIASGESRPIAQDNTAATPAPKIQPEDALIEFDQPAPRVAAFIRGMATKPGAYTFFRGQMLKVHFARVSELPADSAMSVGSILPDRKALRVVCRDGAIELTKVVPAGRKEMDGVSFINGFRPVAGESFTKEGKMELL
jgi:methionyl-tRNA formyltransferase